MGLVVGMEVTGLEEGSVVGVEEGEMVGMTVGVCAILFIK